MGMDWIYNGEIFTSNEAIADGYIGFVYIITNLIENKSYIGKKLLISKRKMPALKGINGRTRRRRTKIVETDWQTYYGSNEELKTLVEEVGEQHFRREVLHLCRTKGELSYRELQEQMAREVLLSDDYYNGIINARIHKSHVQHLKND